MPSIKTAKSAPARQAGPTRERLHQADQMFEIGGDNRTGYRFLMLDTPLGRAVRRRKLSPEGYRALQKYALHWFASGLAGHLSSIDPNRILAADPVNQTGLARSEAAADHRKLYHAAQQYIGQRRAYVADQVACYEMTLEQIGRSLGYASPYRAREKAAEILREAGEQLTAFWTRHV